MRRVSRSLLRSTPIKFSVGPDKDFTGILCNVSILGLGVLTNQPLQMDTPVKVHIPGRPGGAASFLGATIRHATAQTDGLSMLGFQLERPLRVDELLAIG
jgi:hypothetical protein